MERRMITMEIEKKLMNSLNNELALSNEEVEVITFGYRLFIYSVFGYLVIAILAYLLGTLGATLTAAITASLFRIFSGGAHASTQKRCVAVGAIIFNILGFVANIYYDNLSIAMLKQFSWIVAIIALISFIVYAPADTPGKPIATKVQRYKLKWISIGLLIVWFILTNFVFKVETNIHKLYFLASILGLTWQSVSLWPVTYRLIISK